MDFNNANGAKPKGSSDALRREEKEDKSIELLEGENICVYTLTTAVIQLHSHGAALATGCI